VLCSNLSEAHSDRYFTEVCSSSEAGSYLRLIEVPSVSGIRTPEEPFESVLCANLSEAHADRSNAFHSAQVYRGTWLRRKRPPLGPYSSPMPMALRWS